MHQAAEAVLQAGTWDISLYNLNSCTFQQLTLDVRGMSDCAQPKRDQAGQIENDGLESENMVVFMNEADSGDLGLSNEPTYCSCIWARNECEY